MGLGPPWIFSPLVSSFVLTRSSLLLPPLALSRRSRPSFSSWAQSSPIAGRLSSVRHPDSRQSHHLRSFTVSFTGPCCLPLCQFACAVPVCCCRLQCYLLLQPSGNSDFHNSFQLIPIFDFRPIFIILQWWRTNLLALLVSQIISLLLTILYGF